MNFTFVVLGEENVQSYVKMEPWASRFHSRRGPSLPVGALSPSKGSSPVPTPRRHPTDESDLARRLFSNSSTLKNLVEMLERQTTLAILRK